MRISGRRRDGALHLSMGGGISVILRNDRISPPAAEEIVDKMGPWAPVTVSLEYRREIEKIALSARSMPFEKINMAMSFDEQRERVITALRARLGFPTNNGYPGPIGSDLYVPMNGMGEDWVVYCIAGKHYGISYSIGEDGAVAFQGEAEEVAPSWETVSTRADEAGFEEEVSANEQYHGLRQTDWFKKFMASKKKMLTVEPPVPIPPGSDEEKSTSLKPIEKKEEGEKDLTIELPNSLPDMNKPVV